MKGNNCVVCPNRFEVGLATGRDRFARFDTLKSCAMNSSLWDLIMVNALENRTSRFAYPGQAMEVAGDNLRATRNVLMLSRLRPRQPL